MCSYLLKAIIIRSETAELVPTPVPLSAQMLFACASYPALQKQHNRANRG